MLRRPSRYLNEGVADAERASLRRGIALVGAIKSPSLVTGERIAVSEGNGRFVFMSVPPGTYALTAALDGFRTYTTSGIVVRRGDKVDLKVGMQTGSYEEAIVVTGAAPVVDTRSAQVDTTFTDEMLEKVPTARNATRDQSQGVRNRVGSRRQSSGDSIIAR